jgi:ribosomal protein S18 acetylase RimI-like enzyme
MDQARKALGAPSDDDLAVVARLIVDPRKRRIGAGRALLDHAARAARHRHPILDVATRYEAANALYTAAGWTNAGEVEMRFADGTVLQSYVYVAPTTETASL